MPRAKAGPETALSFLFNKDESGNLGEMPIIIDLNRNSMV
jgi:hypothetical protein